MNWIRSKKTTKNVSEGEASVSAKPERRLSTKRVRCHQTATICCVINCTRRDLVTRFFYLYAAAAYRNVFLCGSCAAAQSSSLLCALDGRISIAKRVDFIHYRRLTSATDYSSARPRLTVGFLPVDKWKWNWDSSNLTKFHQKVKC